MAVELEGVEEALAVAVVAVARLGGEGGAVGGALGGRTDGGDGDSCHSISARPRARLLPRPSLGPTLAPSEALLQSPAILLCFGESRYPPGSGAR